MSSFQETVFDIIVSYVADSAFSCSSPVNGTVVAEDKYTVGLLASDPVP